ncbi:hypothetical protein [Siminovitchia sp. 179-K 8D1 HS]|uniref:hypothetical protein n=1 Tax=Siminovitchia sp. 179-K 8D1 HS TaxID=3142385 RepID=UPI00399FD391
MDETRDKMIQLKKLLLDVNESLEMNEKEWFDCIAGNHYPFDHSFSDVVCDMVNWIDYSVKYYDDSIEDS